jgi:amino acid adenylation domain-containing protein
MSNRGEASSYTFDYRVSKFDLTLTAAEGDHRLWLHFEYCTRLFKEETLRRFIGYFERIVTAVLENPAIRIGEIEIVGEEEKKQILDEFNDTAKEIPKEKPFPELFRQQVERAPDRTALTSENAQLTYDELNKRADQLARQLREKGIIPDSIVGIMVERSLEMIISALAVLKAGGGYLPIDPEYPEERIAYMLEDSGAKVLLTDLPEGHRLFNCQLSIVNCQLLMSAPNTPLRHSSFIETPNHSGLAYVIYTSGTTGRPKGVLVEHGNLMAYVNAFLQEFKPGPGDIAILEASFAFDAFVEEVYPILLAGGRCRIAGKYDVMDAHLLEAFIIKNNITIISCSPLLLNEINRFADLKGLPVHTFISGADVLKREYIDRLVKICTVYNAYGPTETTVCAAYYKLPGDIEANIPVGKPISNYRVYILGANSELQAIGVPGELCISGAGVARGYLNNPELTSEKFPPAGDPLSFSASQLLSFSLYRTGDLGRWLPDPAARGAYIIEFLGRIDFQVKIRGYRIELGEIESYLATHPAVKEAVVLAREKESAEKFLCAYIVPSLTGAGASLTGAGASGPYSPDLKEHLSRSLPDYMIPDYFVTIDHIPLTPNGKVDRKALPEPELEAGDDYEAPRSEIERKLVHIWSEVLAIGSDIIGIGDDFFERGGHSLKATVLVSKIQKECSITIPLVEVFKTPTIKYLAEYISKHRAEKEIFVVEDENLVMLRKEGDDAGHLFFVHDVTGGVDGYIEFCNHLNNGFNCWGIRAGKLEGDGQNLTIEALAGLYTEKIRKIQPRGPFFIAGWSIGGTIAFEIVKQLEQAGETPGFLALIDAPPPKKITSKRKRIKANEAEPRQDVIRALVEARDRYRPGDKVNTTVYFFKASRSRIPNKKRWSNYFKEPVTFYDINGDHFSILKMPNVAAFSELFARVINHQV